MSQEPRLAVTVHHQGRKYRAGMTAEQIGPAAGEIGAHAWVDEKAPAKSAVPKEGTPAGGSYTATPPTPTPSALPTPGPSEVSGADAVEAAENEPATRKAGGRGRSGGGSPSE